MQYISMDIDDREDFKMTAQENTERFEDAMSCEAISAEIADRVPKNTTITATWAHSI